MDTILIAVVAAGISLAILYLIIGNAVKAATKDQLDRAEVQNRLLAKMLEKQGVPREEIDALMII